MTLNVHANLEKKTNLHYFNKRQSICGAMGVMGGWEGSCRDVKNKEQCKLFYVQSKIASH